MILELNWNKERWRTRDLLLEYFPPEPHTEKMPYIYPWGRMNNSMMAQELYEIAKYYGFNGTQEEFFQIFISGNNQIVIGTLATFPTPGEENNLYFDRETEILYCFRTTTNPIDKGKFAEVGIAIVGEALVGNKFVTYLYVPIKAIGMAGED